jgi:hypothetical protein
MKKFFFFLPLVIFLFFLPPPIHAADPPHELHGLCCDNGFTYNPAGTGACVDNGVPVFCATAGNTVSVAFMLTPAMSTICGLPIVGPIICSTLGSVITSLVKTTCTDFFAVAGSFSDTILCTRFLDPVEQKINSFPIAGPYITDAINAWQSTCENAVNSLLTSLPIHPTVLPYCINPFTCVAGTCMVAGYIAAGQPWCDFISPDSGIRTAIGCVPPTTQEMIVTLTNWGTGLAGGLALIMIIYAAITITTASGDARKIQAGREMILSALGGLVLIVLAVVLLQFFGTQILNLSPLGF